MTTSQMAKNRAAPPLTPIEQTVQANVKRLLDASGHSQRELARAVGHSDAWASDVLGGHRPIRLADVDLVADFLKVPLTALLFPEGLTASTPTDADLTLTASTVLRRELTTARDALTRSLAELTRLDRRAHRHAHAGGTRDRLVQSAIEKALTTVATAAAEHAATAAAERDRVLLRTGSSGAGHRRGTPKSRPSDPPDGEASLPARRAREA